MSTKTKTAPNPNKDAAEIRAKMKTLKAAAKDKTTPASRSQATKRGSVKTEPQNGALYVIPSADESAEIIRELVTFSEDKRIVTGIKSQATAEQAFVIFDAAKGQQDVWQIFLGSAIFHLRDLPAFGGREAFAEAMAKSGRGLSSVQKYLRAYEQSTPEILALNLPYTATSKIGKVKDVEKKNALAARIAEAKESGDPMTVVQIEKEADKLQPKKKAKSKDKPAEVALNADEKKMLRNLEELLEPPCEYIEKMGEFDKILAAAPADDTEKLRGMLKTLVKFAANMEK